jgi:hypothetical protein
VKLRTASLVALAAIWCGACGSPGAPSVETVYELRIAESPSCAGMVRDPANFFKFGVVTVHMKGSFSEGTFLLVDDSLAVFGSQCTNNSRPALRLAGSSAGGGVVSGRLDGGVWSATACIGSYVGAQGTVSGTRDATSASGVLNGSLFNGIFALNFAGSCTATDHSWSLKPAGVQP